MTFKNVLSQNQIQRRIQGGRSSYKMGQKSYLLTRVGVGAVENSKKCILQESNPTFGGDAESNPAALPLSRFCQSSHVAPGRQASCRIFPCFFAGQIEYFARENFKILSEIARRGAERNGAEEKSAHFSFYRKAAKRSFRPLKPIINTFSGAAVISHFWWILP